jgi:CO/xanthine dehydrogenase FAD-binding subunit
MRGYIPNYELITPSSLEDALGLMATNDWRPFAGGTDLMVLLEAGKLPHLKYINIWSLDELRGVNITSTEVTLGALTTYSEIQANKVLQDEFPMLCQAASETGGLAVQNRGTLGGNIVNASPAADSPPALLAYDAEVELSSQEGSRWLPYHGFHTGYKQMLIRPDELLTRIRLPRNKSGWIHYFRKVGTRKAQAISKVCFSSVAQLSDNRIADVRLVFGSVAPIVLRCNNTEAALRGKTINPDIIDTALNFLRTEIMPIDDIRSSAAYRLQVALNLLTDFLSNLASTARH